MNATTYVPLEYVDKISLLTSIRKDFMPLAQSKTIRLTGSQNSDKVLIHTHVTFFIRSLSNLLGNTLKSTPENDIGLGLALTKQMIKQCGGSIALKSTPNVGTTFTVSFPV